MSKDDDEKLEFESLQPLESLDAADAPPPELTPEPVGEPGPAPLADLGDLPGGLAEGPAGDIPAPPPASPLEDLESIDLATGAKKKGKAKRRAVAAATGPSETLWVRLQRTSPYTVLLGLSLLALLIGAIFFILELSAYKFDWSATEGKQRVEAPAAEVVIPDTTAIA